MAKKIPDTNVCVQLVFVGPCFLFSFIWMLPFSGDDGGFDAGYEGIILPYSDTCVLLITV